MSQGTTKHRVFVTGATGYLGSAVAARLARAGHDVRGLIRDPAGAAALEALGVKPVPAQAGQPERLIAQMKNCDALVHCAYDARRPAEADRHALDMIRTAALDGRVRRLLYTSGIWVHGDTGGQVADERTPLAPAEVVRWRPAHEDAALDLAEHEVVVTVLRPGIVYGGTGGIFGGWFDEAREHQHITYPGDGSHHWPTVHRDDMAEGYALALEHATGAERYLLVDESRHTVREMAEAAAAAAGVPAVAGGREALLEAEGPRGAALLLDQRFTSLRARRELGWVPRHASFVTGAGELWREWLAASVA